MPTSALMQHITEEDVQRLRDLVPAFETAQHLMTVRGDLNESQLFWHDARTLEDIIGRIA